jgi:hypothetical protein
VQSALIFAFILLEAIGQMAALWRMTRERLYLRNAAFAGLTILTSSRAVFSLASRGHVHPYFEFWRATMWPLALLGAAAAVEAFWRLALHFRNMRGFGSILLGVIIGVAVLAARIVTAMNSTWDGPVRGPLAFEECVEVALMIVAILSLGFFRSISSMPVRPNAVRHLMILSFLFGTSFFGNFIELVNPAHGAFVANVMITLGLAMSYWWWAIVMRRSGEILPFPIPPLTSAEEIEGLKAWDRRLYAEGKGVIDRWNNPA